MIRGSLAFLSSMVNLESRLFAGFLVFRMRTARIGILLLPLAVLPFATTSTPAQEDWIAFHKRDVEKASVRSGLSKRTIAKLLDAAGQEANPQEIQYVIQTVDAVSLKRRHQVLLALTDFGTSHALSVHVISAAASKYVELWGTREIPSWNECDSMNLSTESMLGIATASAKPNGQITIKIPVREPERLLLVATFVWLGKTYRVASVREFSKFEWKGQDWEEQGAGHTRACAENEQSE